MHFDQYSTSSDHSTPHGHEASLWLVLVCAVLIYNEIIRDKKKTGLKKSSIPRPLSAFKGWSIIVSSAHWSFNTEFEHFSSVLINTPSLPVTTWTPLRKQTVGVSQKKKKKKKLFSVQVLNSLSQTLLRLLQSINQWSLVLGESHNQRAVRKATFNQRHRPQNNKLKGNVRKRGGARNIKQINNYN